MRLGRVACEAQPREKAVRARLQEAARVDEGAVFFILVALELHRVLAILTRPARGHLHREVLLVEGKVLQFEALLERSA
eukprot:scaffold90928_cov28-Tisochrysis_lutea.AAC.2